MVEAEISKAMEWQRVKLVGWYHSHPRSHASPSLRDVDSQLDYQIRMKGPSDNGYTPCVGLICCEFAISIIIITQEAKTKLNDFFLTAPYNADGNCYESNFNVFWSMPPPENRPHEYPRPMLLSYTLAQEPFISQDGLDEIVSLAQHKHPHNKLSCVPRHSVHIFFLPVAEKMHRLLQKRGWHRLPDKFQQHDNIPRSLEGE